MRFKLEGLKDLGDWSVDELCKTCNENKSECLCGQPAESLEPSKHALVFRLEKRNGKLVTVICPFFVDDTKLKDTLSSLKKSLGVGGAIKTNELELQGDLKDKAKAALEKMGFKFKK